MRSQFTYPFGEITSGLQIEFLLTRLVGFLPSFYMGHVNAVVRNGTQLA
uniref:Uncharacterized protein n=1 Tax=Anguilla anguilla TaxID=7936 RepID=A0A0E9SHN1_ANGAN